MSTSSHSEKGPTKLITGNAEGVYPTSIKKIIQGEVAVLHGIYVLAD